MKVSVVIPCFNERSTIEQVVNSVRGAPIQNIYPHQALRVRLSLRERIELRALGI